MRGFRIQNLTDSYTHGLLCDTIAMKPSFLLQSVEDDAFNNVRFPTFGDVLKSEQYWQPCLILHNVAMDANP
jgi:hypothetical protein